MCPDKFYIKVGDLLPEITAQLLDADRNPVSLASASSVKFDMWIDGAEAKKINAADAVIVSASLGQVKYVWAGTDTNTEGTYFCQWKVTFSDTRIQHFPSDDQYPLVIITDTGP